MNNIENTSPKFPLDYPHILRNYSWSIAGKVGIMPFWTKFTKKAQYDSPIFIYNQLKVIFQRHRVKLTPSVNEYIKFVLKCFSVSWDETEMAFKVKLKYKKDQNGKSTGTQITSTEFYEVSEKLGIAKNFAKQFLREGILKELETYYNKFLQS